MTAEQPVSRRGAAVLALITLRFVLALALWSSFTVSAVRRPPSD